MPPAMFQKLKNVKISGRRLDISRVDHPSDSQERPGPEVSDVAASAELPVQKTIDARPADERPFQKNHRMRTSSEIGTASRNFRRKPKSGAVHSFGKKTTKRRKVKLGLRSSR